MTDEELEALFDSDDEPTETAACPTSVEPARPGWWVVMEWTDELTAQLLGQPYRELATIVSREAARHQSSDDPASQERAAHWRALAETDQISAADVAHEMAVDRAGREG